MKKQKTSNNAIVKASNDVIEWHSVIESGAGKWYDEVYVCVAVPIEKWNALKAAIKEDR